MDLDSLYRLGLMLQSQTHIMELDLSYRLGFMVWTWTNHQTSPTPKEQAHRWWLSQSGGLHREESPVLQRDLWELQIVSIDFIHDCTLVLYKQLFKTGFDCYPSYFPLSWAFRSTSPQPMGEPPHTSSIASQQRLGLAPMIAAAAALLFASKPSIQAVYFF